MLPPTRHKKQLKNLVVEGGANNQSLDFDDETAKILEAFPLDVSTIVLSCFHFD